MCVRNLGIWGKQGRCFVMPQKKMIEQVPPAACEHLYEDAAVAHVLLHLGSKGARDSIQHVPTRSLHGMAWHCSSQACAQLLTTWLLSSDRWTYMTRKLVPPTSMAYTSPLSMLQWESRFNVSHQTQRRLHGCVQRIA